VSGRPRLIVRRGLLGTRRSPTLSTS